MTPRAVPTRSASPFASWSAPAERSGDGAFVRTREPRAFEDLRPHESGVALQLPAAVHDAPRNSAAPPLLPIAGMDWWQAWAGRGWGRGLRIDGMRISSALRVAGWPGRGGRATKKILGFTKVDDVGFCWGFRRFWRRKSRFFWGVQREMPKAERCRLKRTKTRSADFQVCCIAGFQPAGHLYFQHPRAGDGLPIWKSAIRT